MRKFYQIRGKENLQEIWQKGEHDAFSVVAQTKFEQTKDNENVFKVIMSTDSEDRHGDVVKQNWELKNFKKNPVLLDSHNYNSIEHVLGRVNKPKIKDGALQGDVEFILDNPKGMLARKMVEGGFLNATSVGFIPLEFGNNGEITKSELLELSAVSVPANPEALFEKSVDKNEDDDTETPDDETPEEEMVETPEDDEETPQEAKQDVTEAVKVNKYMQAIKKINAKEKRRQELLNESLGVIRQLQAEKKPDRRKQMVNRAIRQLLKVKG